MGEIIKAAVASLGGISSSIVAISACLMLFVKPLRNWVARKFTNNQAITKGIVATLRHDITGIYHNYLPDKCLPAYERKNVVQLYEAYSEFNKNSYIQDVYAQMLTWPVDDGPGGE